MPAGLTERPGGDQTLSARTAFGAAVCRPDPDHAMPHSFEQPAHTRMQSDLGIDVLTSVAEMAAMKEDWNALLDQSVYPTVYMRYEYIEAALRHLGRPDDELFIIVIRDRATFGLTAIYPMKLKRVKRYSLNLRILEYAVIREIDKPYPIIKHGWESRVWPAFCGFVSRMTPKWDLMELMEAPDNTELQEAIRVFFSGSKHIVRIGERKESHLVDLTQAWSSVWRKHIHMRRMCRKIARDFGDTFTYDIKNCLNDSDSGLDTYIGLETRSWKQGRIGISKNADITAFYRRLFRDFCPLGFVKLGFLYLNDRAIAGEIAYVYNSNVYFAHGSFDEAYRKYSPGLVSKALFLKSFHEQEYRTGDYLAGYAGYLKNWSTGTIDCRDVRVLRRCFKVHLFLILLWAAKVPFRRFKGFIASLIRPERPLDENTPA
jgi:hypothetical protein